MLLLYGVLLLTGIIKFVHKPRSSRCIEPNKVALLVCDVKATPVAGITWLKNGREISKADHHFLMLQNHSNNITSSFLIIYDTTTTDEGTYTCLATSPSVTRRIHSYVTVSSECGEFTTPWWCYM